jgi:hypothetical protein
LLQRRFDVVYAFHDRGLNNGFGGDRLEDAYTWKLDEVIRRKYRLARLSPALEAARTVPIEFGVYESPGVYVRRPGPDPAPWLSACFGPFRLRATTWDIRTGGGLWCRLPRDGQTLRLVTTPAPVTEVRSQERGAPRGTVGINLAARGTFAELVPAGADPGWTLRVERPASRRRPAVTLAIGGRLRGTMSPRAWPVRLHLRPGSPPDLHLEGDAIVARIPRGERPLLLRASTTSGATFDLADLRLG